MRRMLALAAGLVLASLGSVQAQTLLLSHWNSRLDAEVAGGSPVAVVEGDVFSGTFGYPFSNSMPAVGGLEIAGRGALAYDAAGNLDPAQGTIEFRTYLRQTPDQGRVVLLDAGTLSIALDADKKMLVYAIGDCSVSTTVQWRANAKWHHIAAAWSLERHHMKLFIDGRFAGATGIREPVSVEGKHIRIGPDANAAFDELRILDYQADEIEIGEHYCREYEFAPQEPRPQDLFEPIDISPVANTGFVDEEAADEKGGWSDQGAGNDAREIPIGRMMCLDIPFDIAAPVDGNTCVAVRGSRRMYFAPKSAPLAIGKTYRALLFLHTAAWCMHPNLHAADYHIEYADGTTVDVPVVSAVHVGDWWYPQDLQAARVAYTAPATGRALYMMKWDNPHPEKVIKSIVFESNETDLVPIWVGLTGVKTTIPPTCVQGLDRMFFLASDDAGIPPETIVKDYADVAARRQAIVAAVQSLEKEPLEMALDAARMADMYRQIARIYLDAGLAAAQKIGTLDTQAAAPNEDQLTAMREAVTYLQYAGRCADEAQTRLTQSRETKIGENFLKIQAEYPKAAATDQPQSTADAPRLSVLLNGVWEAGTGGTPDDPPSEWQPVRMPHQDGTIKNQTWLRKEIWIPPSWSASRLAIAFSRIRSYGAVFVNGHFAGDHLGVDPFEVDITPFAAPGKLNVVHVYTEGSGRAHFAFVPRDKKSLGLGGQRWFATAADYHHGVWEDITLHKRPPLAVQDVLIRPGQAKESVLMTLEVANRTDAARKVTLRPVIRRDGETCFKLPPQTVDLAAGGHAALRFEQVCEGIRHWGIGGDYGDPVLYFMDIEVNENGQTVDRDVVRFGLRTFQIDGTRFKLNGKDIVLQGDHLWATEGHGAEASRWWKFRYYRLARDANFNLVRYHWFTSAPESSYTVADELGHLVEPEGDMPIGRGVPSDYYGRANFDDPAWRRGIERYYRNMARRYRHHPSAVIFSLTNELFQSSDEWIPDGIRRFLAFGQLVRDTNPNMITTEQGNNGYEGFPIVDIHYASRKFLADWPTRNDRPAINGEWSVYEGGYFAMNSVLDPNRAAEAVPRTAKKFHDDIRFEIENGVAGTMPFPAFYIGSFTTAKREWMSPWADLYKENLAEYGRGDRWYMPEGANVLIDQIPWPSLSGPDVKVESFACGTQCDNINWFDPNRPEVTMNPVWDAFRQAFNPMPPLQPTKAPELIVTVLDQTGNPCDGAIVVLTPAGGQSANPSGVLTDPAGTAWFVLAEPGPYRVEACFRGQTVAAEVATRETPLAAKPGYDDIDRCQLRLTP